MRRSDLPAKALLRTPSPASLAPTITRTGRFFSGKPAQSQIPDSKKPALSGLSVVTWRSAFQIPNMAQRTGLEPATPGVTGRYSNRLNYRCA